MNTLFPLRKSLDLYWKTLEPVVQAISQKGGTAYLVGGSVRDLVLHRPVKDLDVEVHGIDLATLRKALSLFGHVEEIGKKFGVLVILGTAIDWSLPRTDSAGRKPLVQIDPNIGITRALQRRDLTMNAMAINLSEFIAGGCGDLDCQKIIDPFSGLADMAAQTMRAVDVEFFVQDPLRMLRVMQFIGRFEMQPDETLDAICSTMPLNDPQDGRPLARERIHDEIMKLFLQAEKPSLGIAWLSKIGRIAEIFPWLSDEKILHEACQLLDRVAAAAYTLPAEIRFCLSAAALYLPKGMVAGSLSMKKDFSRCTGAESSLKVAGIILGAVQDLTTLADDEGGIISCKRIAARIEPYATLVGVSYLWWAVFQPDKKTVQETLLYRLAEQGNVLDKAEEPIVTGNDLMARGIQPGPQMGKLLVQIYDLQLRGERDKEKLLATVVGS